MDRREALIKMAAGSTALVGASMVMTSVAFADGGTATCKPVTEKTKGPPDTVKTPWLTDLQSTLDAVAKLNDGKNSPITDWDFPATPNFVDWSDSA